MENIYQTHWRRCSRCFEQSFMDVQLTNIRKQWMKFIFRIRRGEKSYITRAIGISNDDLSVLASYFDNLWSMPSKNLNNAGQLNALVWTGYRLKCMGRFEESMPLMFLSQKKIIDRKSWINASIITNNISEAYLLWAIYQKLMTYQSQASNTQNKPKIGCKLL
ncbi:MAG: hypothetical protein R3E95_23445 [Thiolinea sp.]